MRLKSKTALVTGAGGGLGGATARRFAAEGAAVLCSDLNLAQAEKTVADINSAGATAIAFECDVADANQCKAQVAETISQFGHIDILVNNVGGGSVAEIDDKDNPLAEVEAMWDGTYAMSLKAPVLMCEAVMPHLIEKKSGKIVNISSMAGRPGMPHVDLVPLSSSYHSAKAGLIRYTQLLADQMGRHNINVNAICPGIIYTDGWKEISEEMVKHHPSYKGEDPREWFLGVSGGRYAEGGLPQTPMRREQTTEDIAEAVLFLASEASANITGQTLNVDGGMVKD